MEIKKKHLTISLWHFFYFSDTETLVQSFEHGLVVVSFGGNVNYLPSGTMEKLVNVFRQRKELFVVR